MAEQHRKGFFLFRPKFLLLCLYVLAYILLRMKDEVVYRQYSVPDRNGGAQIYRAASANPGIPFWRQQTWRAIFSAAMVVEEEGQPVISRVRRWIGQEEDAGAAGSLIDRAIEAGRNLLPNQAPRQPPPQARQQPVEGLREGERMVYDPRTQQR